MVEVKIDKGDATVPTTVVQALQQYALDLFDTMIAERFLVPADTDTQPLEFEPDDAAGPGVHRRPWRARVGPATAATRCARRSTKRR